MSGIIGGTTSLATRKQAEELLAELRRQAYAEGYEQAKKDAEKDAEIDKVWKDITNPPKPLAESPQEKRDRIVEQAKADILELIPEDNGYDGIYYRVVKNNEEFVCSADFVVNKEKRTVVVLMKGWFNGEVLAKGIAKCAPDDCFNVHIGKAIAIRRALGLEVPDEYLNAPQPTEVREGDVVKGSQRRPHFYNTDRTFTLINNFGVGNGYFNYKEDSEDWISKKDIGKIIDDSESIAP